MLQRRKEKRSKEEQGDVKQRTKQEKNLRITVSAAMMEASLCYVTGNLVPRLIISLALIW